MPQTLVLPAEASKSKTLLVAPQPASKRTDRRVGCRTKERNSHTVRPVGEEIGNRKVAGDCARLNRADGARLSTGLRCAEMGHAQLACHSPEREASHIDHGDLPMLFNRGTKPASRLATRWTSFGRTRASTVVGCYALTIVCLSTAAAEAGQLIVANSSFEARPSHLARWEIRPAGILATRRRCR